MIIGMSISSYLSPCLAIIRPELVSKHDSKEKSRFPVRPATRGVKAGYWTKGNQKAMKSQDWDVLLNSAGHFSAEKGKENGFQGGKAGRKSRELDFRYAGERTYRTDRRRGISFDGGCEHFLSTV